MGDFSSVIITCEAPVYLSGILLSAIEKGSFEERLAALEAAVRVHPSQMMRLLMKKPALTLSNRRDRTQVATMLNQKRLIRIEASLTPKQAVLLWLRQEYQGRTSLEYGQWLIQRPASAAPRSRVERLVVAVFFSSSRPDLLPSSPRAMSARKSPGTGTIHSNIC